MQTTSTAFKTALSSGTRYPKSYLEITTADGETFTVNKPSDIVTPVSINSRCFDADFEIGTVYASDMTVTLNNADGRWDGINLDGATIVPYSGLTLANDTVEYVKMGKFYVDDPDYPYDQLSLNASDGIIKLDEEFIYVPITYPATNLQILQAIATYCGITLAASVSSAANMSYSVTAAPDDSYTCRDIVSMICAMAAGFGRMNRNGQFEIVTIPKLPMCNELNGISSDSFLIDGNSTDNTYLIGAGFTDTFGYQGVICDMPAGSRFDFRQTSDLTIISGVVFNFLDAGEQNTIVLGADNYLLEIPEIPIVTHDYDTIAQNIYDAVAGMAYTAYSAEYPGNPALDPGDVVRHTTKTGKEIISLITGHTFAHAGSCIMEAVAKSKTTKKYKPKSTRMILNAQTAAQAVKMALNELAPGGLIEAAKLGTTVMEGGYIKTDLIDVFNLFVQHLSNGADSDFQLTPGDVTVDGHVEHGVLGYLKSYSTSIPLFSLTCNRTPSLNLSYATLKLAGMIFQGINYDTGAKYINIDTGDSLLTLGKTLSYLATRVGGNITNMIATTETGVFYSKDGGTTKNWMP